MSMLDHKLEPKAVRRVEVITGPGGCRRFPDDEKARIIDEALVPGAVIDDEERAGPFVPIWALAYEDHPDPTMRPYKEPMTAERREGLIVSMAAATKRLFDDLAIERRLASSASSTYIRSTPKVGRNDPCPCGSGKKFKKCCGAAVIH